VIRRGFPEDAEWIRETAALVYAPLGDYRTIIPSWMAHPGVLTFLDVDDDGPLRRGFILLGFYEPSDRPEGGYVADLIAIGVAPPFQRLGSGKRLMGYALDLATLAGKRALVPEIRLTVAEDNARARRLFHHFGFEVLDAQHGAYDGGQRAIRMRCRLPAPPPP
jgi:ribosomal protein S18 acetylase RimI-like enzyme